MLERKSRIKIMEEDVVDKDTFLKNSDRLSAAQIIQLDLFL